MSFFVLKSLCIFGKRETQKLICSTVLSISRLKAPYKGVFCFSATKVPKHKFHPSGVHPNANAGHFKIKSLGFVLESRIMNAIVYYQKEGQQAVVSTGKNILKKKEKGTAMVPLINPSSEPIAKGLKMIFKLCYNPHCSKDNKKLQQVDLIFQTKNDSSFCFSKDYHHFWVRMKSAFLFEKERILSWNTTPIRPLKVREETLN